MSRSARVFFLKNPRHFSVSSAAKFGEISILMDDDTYSMFQLAELSDQINKRLNEVDFNTDHDMIAVTGQIGFVSLLAAICAARYEEFNVLIFDSRNGGHYILRRFKREFLSGKVKVDENEALQS